MALNRDFAATLEFRLHRLFLFRRRLALHQRRNLRSQWLGLNRLFLFCRLSAHDRLRHAHDLISDAVGFLFVLVPGRADFQLGL
ncbi:hypothetical protein HUU40_30435 [candidate division KSB1 bacterium]|nr:hypothetical protein [candidate division KSB1 bacterium]